MNKLFPNSLEFIKRFAFEKHLNTDVYKIKKRVALEFIHQQTTDCSFFELNTEDFFINANKFLCNQVLEPKQKDYFKKLTSPKNSWDYIGMPKNSNYDFISMLVIFKHLLNEGDTEIKDLDQYLDQYINNILNNIYTKFFEIEIDYDDEGNKTRVTKFFPENFPYKLIEDETFMTRYFYEISKKLFYLDISDYFDKYSYHFDNYKFLELALSNMEITNILMQNDNFKIKANNFYTNKPDALIEVLHKNGSLLEFLPEGLKNKFDLVYAAINNNPNAYVFADESLKRNSIIINLVLQKGFLRILPDEIKNNEELARISILLHPNTILDAGYDIRHKKDLLLFSLKSSYFKIITKILDIIPVAFLDDIDFITQVLFLQPRKYKWFYDKVPRIFENNEVCRKVLEYEGSALRLFPENKKNDPQLVTISVSNDINNIKFAGLQIRSNKQFMHDLVNKNIIAYCYFEGEIKQDYELALNIINKSPEAYSYLPDQYKNDPKIMTVLLDSIFNNHLPYSQEWPKLEDDNNENDINDVIAAIFDDD